MIRNLVLKMSLIVLLATAFTTADAHWGWRRGYGCHPYPPRYFAPPSPIYSRPYSAPPVYREEYIRPHWRRTPYGEEWVEGHWRRVRLY